MSVTNVTSFLSDQLRKSGISFNTILLSKETITKDDLKKLSDPFYRLDCEIQNYCKKTVDSIVDKIVIESIQNKTRYVHKERQTIIFPSILDSYGNLRYDTQKGVSTFPYLLAALKEKFPEFYIECDPLQTYIIIDWS